MDSVPADRNSHTRYGTRRACHVWGFNRALDRRHERLLASERGGSSRELEEVRSRIEALEETAFRVQELEERVDFAERLLTRDQHQIGSKDGG